MSEGIRPKSPNLKYPRLKSFKLGCRDGLCSHADYALNAGSKRRATTAPAASLTKTELKGRRSNHATIFLTSF